ncbi:MAG TPA: hypothetical protein VMK66_04080 [Myxococcales bacterium]|nr:hypothetical protein [Myxococcales bacterium]
MHLLAVLLLAAPAAPSTDYPTTKGTAGVSFVLPGGGSPTIGATYFLSNDVALQVDFGLEAPISPGGTGQNLLFSLGGGLRFYPLKHNHVGVYLEPLVILGRELSPAVTAEAALFFQLGGAIGVEYFFFSHFSAGALLGLTLKLANLSGPAGTPVYTTLSTATTGLTANIYF